MTPFRPHVDDISGLDSCSVGHTSTFFYKSCWVDYNSIPLSWVPTGDQRGGQAPVCLSALLPPSSSGAPVALNHMVVRSARALARDTGSVRQRAAAQPWMATRHDSGRTNELEPLCWTHRMGDTLGASGTAG
jgi:hypothetical protein